MKKLVLTLVLLLFFVESADAQSFYSRRRDRTWMFSFGLGASTYHGDLHEFTYDRVRSAINTNIGIGIRKKLGSQLSMRLDLNVYSIGGDDADNGTLNGKDPDNRVNGRDEFDDRFIRNLRFDSRNIEASLLFNFNLIPVEGSSARRPILNPYIIFGIGFTTNNPTTIHPDTGEKINLRELNTEALDGTGYGATAMVIPAGFGIRLKANQYIDILFEAARRFTFTDYLDDVSTEFPSLDALRNAERIGDIANAERLFDRSAEGGFATRSPGDDRGNPDNNDAYYIFQIRLEMYLPDNFIKALFQPSRRKPKFR